MGFKKVFVLLLVVTVFFSFALARVETKQKNEKTSDYIVFLNGGIDSNIVANFGKIIYKYQNFNAVVATLSETAAAQLAKEPGVQSVEQDSIIQIGPSASKLGSKTIKITKKEKPRLVIVNKQSYPKVGSVWTIKFKTYGKAQLIIEPENGTIWSNKTQDQNLFFLEVNCGGKKYAYIWKDGKVIVNNYKCDGTSQVRLQVLQAGDHSIKISFGKNSSEAYNSTGQWNLGPDGINAEAAWDLIGDYNGPAIKIAIIDSGVKYTLPDFNGKYLDGKDFCVTGNGDSRTGGCKGEDNDPMDGWGHGTEMASAILADGGTVSGVAPQRMVQFYALKISNNDGIASANAVYKALDWIITKGDVDIVYIGVYQGLSTMETRIINMENATNIIFIAPTYALPKPAFPAAFKSVIGVGGYNIDQTIINGSGPDADVIAPAEQVPVVRLDGTASYAADGIGAAAAQGAGMLALMKMWANKNSRDYNNSFYFSTLKQSANHVSTISDSNQGHGRADVVSAINWMANNWYLGYHIGYINPPGGYDASGNPIYFIGWPMDYNVTIINNSSKTISDLNILSETLYYDGSTAGPPVNGVPIFNSPISQILYGESTTLGPYSFIVPNDTMPGLDSTKLIIKTVNFSEDWINALFKDSIIKTDPTAGIFCPPAPATPDTAQEATVTAVSEQTSTAPVVQPESEQGFVVQPAE